MSSARRRARIGQWCPRAPRPRPPNRAFPMKLATYKDGSRDGQLVVVSRDLASAHYATGIASRLQQVLDDWNFLVAAAARTCPRR